MSAVLVDTGIIVASLDRSERYHQACVAAVGKITSPLVTCEAVIAESCYLLRNLKGAAETVIANVAAGIFQIPFLLRHSAKAVGATLHKYQDSGIDFADACLIHLATDLKSADILTLDRDFERYRWGRNNAFHMLIKLEK